LFDVDGVPPERLSPLGWIVAYDEPPHWSQFQTIEEEHDIHMTASAKTISSTPAFVVDRRLQDGALD
jgi:hypothetical protein